MSAHSVGAANRSQRQLERQRDSALQRQFQRNDEKQRYFQMLAEKLSAVCDLPLSIARKHVEKLSIVANTKHEPEIARSALSFVRFG
jgi:hypothetical protein